MSPSTTSLELTSIAQFGDAAESKNLYTAVRSLQREIDS